MEDDNELNRQYEGLANGLAWFSLALGVSEMVMPDRVADLAGLPRSSAPTLRLLGAREIGHGISILAAPGRTTPVWSRVAGDAIDLAVMLSAYGSEDSDQGRLSMAIGAVSAVTALDVFCASRLNERGDRPTQSSREWMRRGVRVEQVT